MKNKSKMRKFIVFLSLFMTLSALPLIATGLPKDTKGLDKALSTIPENLLPGKIQIPAVVKNGGEMIKAATINRTATKKVTDPSSSTNKDTGLATTSSTTGSYDAKDGYVPSVSAPAATPAAVPPVSTEYVGNADTATAEEPATAEEQVEDLWADAEDDLWADEEAAAEGEDDLWGGGDDLWADDDMWADDSWFEGNGQEIVTTDALITGLTEEDEDFWADFYVAGQEQDIDLPAGSYYMDLYINDRFSGNVEIVSDGSSYGIDAETFRYIVSQTANEEEKIFLDTFVKVIPFASLEPRGYVTNVDTIAYTVDMSMPTSSLDTVILSLTHGGAYGSNMFASRPLGNALEVDNVSFSMDSSYSLSMYVPLYPNFDWQDLLSFDLGVSNRIRLFDVYNQFSYGIGVNHGRFNYRFGLYSFYTDFPGQGLRLSWGNVSGYGRPAKGTPLGFKLEKNASYYDDTWKKQSYITKELVLEEKSFVTILNGDQVMYEGTLDKGTYQLEDFTLLSGSNNIRIEIRPDADRMAEPVIQDFNVLYGYSLLAPGENYWGVSLTGGREQKSVRSKSPVVLSLPYFDGQFLEYDIRNFSLGFYFDIGVYRGMTMRTRGSFGNNPTDTVDWSPSGRFELSLLSTNHLGSASLSAAYWNTVRDGKFFGNNADVNITQSISTGWKWMSSLSMSFSYSYSDSQVLDIMKHSSRYSLSTGGRIGFLNWATALSGSLNWNDFDASIFSLSQSFSIAAGRHANINASLSYSDGFRVEPSISMRLGVSVYLGGASMSASTDDRGNIDYRVSGGKGAHSGSATFNTNWQRGFDTAISGFYSYFGKYFNLGTGLNMTAGWMKNGKFAPEFRNAGISLSLSTASLFADGFFQIRSAIPYNYLMVKQKGALKDNILTTASGNSSAESGVFKQFGVSTIDGVSGYRDQYLTVYSQSEDGQSYYSYNIKIPRSKRNGYVLVLEENFRYTVSGQVPGWYNSSSPLYVVEEELDEEGNSRTVLLPTDQYIFSDETTRFLTSPLLPGLYAFDVPLENGAFRLMMFRVDDRAGEGGVVLMEDIYEVAPLEINPVYTEFCLYDNTRVVTMDEFWEILYPSDDMFLSDFDFGEEGTFSEDGEAYVEEEVEDLWGGDIDLWADDVLDDDGLGTTGEAEPSTETVPEASEDVPTAE